MTGATVAAALEAASKQGVVLSEDLQQQLQALGIHVTADGGSSTANSDHGAAGSPSAGGAGANAYSSSGGTGAVSAAVIQDLLMPGGIATALQLAKARRAAAAAAAASN